MERKVVAASDLSARRANRQIRDRPWVQKPATKPCPSPAAPFVAPTAPPKSTLKPLRFASPPLSRLPKPAKPAMKLLVAMPPLKSCLRSSEAPKGAKSVRWDAAVAGSSPPPSPRPTSPRPALAASPPFVSAARGPGSLPALVAAATALYPPLDEGMSLEDESREIMARIREMALVSFSCRSPPPSSSSSSGSSSRCSSPPSSADDYTSSWKTPVLASAAGRLAAARLATASPVSASAEALSPVRGSAKELLARFREH